MAQTLRILALTDLSNLVGQTRSVGRKPDLLKLQRHLGDVTQGRFIVESIVYASLPPENPGGVERWHDFLRHNGLMVRSKRAKRLPNGQIKCNLDGEIMLDAIELCSAMNVDAVVLVTGDGDFAALATLLRRRGVRVEVASLHEALANELKCAANGVIDLTEWANECEPLNGDAPHEFQVRESAPRALTYESTPST